MYIVFIERGEDDDIAKNIHKITLLLVEVGKYLRSREYSLFAFGKFNLQHVSK